MTDRKPTLKRGDEQLERDLQVIEQIAERYKNCERANEVLKANADKLGDRKG